ncbi:hypothetical protein IHQ71_03280 [Rhizobium sp. TH2]|uniref:hypothetical protein n=1 Tax=Rhizobium sp. TH2 TaxID=2775403 RepID=UPI0021572980|nr:hypothetical protein [Rhizobium sp. TH2]UVC09657.1 hypothetical protein IHQ71_03280 [Rhizobium sp. TH2]
MTSRLKYWALGAIIACTPATAFATGGLGCSIDDGNVNLTFESIFSYSDIGGLFQIRGELESKDKRTEKTLRKFTLDGSELKQQWFRGNDLKLMIYRETEGDGVPFASVKLIIEANKPPEEEFEYSGKYALTIEPATEGSESKAFTVEGKITCSAG